MKQIYFMAGLPRSGATLISSILEQNPSIHCPPSSPLINLMMATYNCYSVPQNIEYDRKDQIYSVLDNIATHFYGSRNEKIIIDKNWAWVQELPSDLIYRHINKNIKFICPVRKVEDVVNSFLNVLNNTSEDNLMDKGVIEKFGKVNNDNRARFILEGLIKENYRVLSQRAQSEEFGNAFLLIPYEDILFDAPQVISNIYSFLDLDSYEHQFKNISNPYDSETQFMKEMHEVRSTIIPRQNKINYIEGLSKSVIDEINQYTPFWEEKGD